MVLGGMLGCVGAHSLTAAEPPADSIPAAKDPGKELEQLRKENEKLQETISQLRQENHQLRKMLGELIEPLSPARVVTPTAPASTNLTNEVKVKEPKISEAKVSETKVTGTKPKVTVAGDQAVTHWLSISGKRHNSTCRYFKYPGGSVCGATDGVACRLCGG